MLKQIRCCKKEMFQTGAIHEERTITLHGHDQTNE